LRTGDRFRSLSEVTQALRQAGLESSNLVVAIDCTKSNKWTGAQSFGGQCLHTIEAGKLNPYQESLKIIGQTLAEFDDDDLIPAFGFGDSVSKDKTVLAFLMCIIKRIQKLITPMLEPQVFPFSGHPDGICHGLRDVLHKYEKMVPSLHLSGPTSFAPVIRKTIEIVQRERSYHILVIVADGQVTEERETIEAIVLASSYPISIIMVGVGDGPWDTMKDFDDRLPKRYFDNFQFVNFTEFKQKGRPPSAFALAALMEIPDQYHYIRANMM
jgi:E3 ubiquitin-protein ligase RGLG